MSIVWTPALTPPFPDSLSGLSSLGTNIYRVMVFEAVHSLKREENDVCELQKRGEETVISFNKLQESYYYERRILNREKESETVLDEEFTNYQINENLNTFKEIANQLYYQEDTSPHHEIKTISKDSISLNLNATCDYVSSYSNVFKSTNFLSQMGLLEKTYDQPKMLGSFKQNTIIKRTDCGSSYRSSKNNPKKFISKNPTKAKCISNNKNKKYKQLRIDELFREKINFNQKWSFNCFKRNVLI